MAVLIMIFRNQFRLLDLENNFAHGTTKPVFMNSVIYFAIMTVLALGQYFTTFVLNYLEIMLGIGGLFFGVYT